MPHLPKFLAMSIPTLEKGQIMRAVIKFCKNTNNVRTMYVSGVPVAVIARLEAGKYIVVDVYNNVVWETSRYIDARNYAMKIVPNVKDSKKTAA